MKTITKWLDMLKEPYRSEALKAFIESRNLIRFCETGSIALSWAFNWADNGGYDKWKHVAENFNDYIDTDGILQRDYNRIPKPIREQFDQFALDVLKTQKKQVKAKTRDKLFLSARYIVWEIRMKTTLTQDGEYKINDKISPCLARMFEKNYPEYKGVFEKRKSKYDLTKTEQ